MSASDLSNVVMGLLTVMAGLEVLLFVFRGSLLQVGQMRGIEREIAKLGEERVEAAERNEDRERELKVATDRVHEAQAALRRAGTESAESEQARDVLVHRLGEPPGQRYRATLTKTLGTPPDPNQLLIWSYPHFVDVWAPDPEGALEVALHSFTDRAGYTLSPFQPLDDRLAPEPDASPDPSVIRRRGAAEMGGMVWLGLALAAGWFAFLLRRFQLYWDTGQGRVMNLGQALRQAERALADEKQRWETLGNKIRSANAQADKARRDEQELRQKMAARGPMVTVEILVTAEYPASSSEAPWVANLSPRAGGANEVSPPPVLLWAPDHPAAIARVKRIADEMRCTVNDIRRLSKARS